MSNLAKLKKKAAEFEARKQYEKALELYEQALNGTRAGEEDLDVPLYNRVGDLHFRIGNNEQAVSYYEKAADLYAEGGFFNNAIALCNKILRHSPGRSNIYYKLGLISAKKGFNSDAKQNFLEYADRMQKVGKMDEAFRALKEFADLCPGQDDVRLMLAEKLARAHRKPEALEQLQLLYDLLESEGRSVEAAAALERMKAIDPAFTPSRSSAPRERKKSGLVFLDLDFDAPSTTDEGTVSPMNEPVVELTFLDPAPAATTDYTSAITPLDLEPLAQLDSIPADADRDPFGSDIPEPFALTDPSLFDTGGMNFESTTDVSDAPSPIPPPVEGREDVSRSDDEFVDLGEWLQQNRTPPSTRMVAHDEEPEDNAQKDFNEMLDKFKAGISRNVDDEDFESHYDLGIAFREMGLYDEAIGSLQKAARGAHQQLRASEAMGQCFMDKGQPSVAVTVLERLLDEPGMDDSRLVGVLYLLGRGAESVGRMDDAAAYYQRVVAVQIGFRDAGERLTRLDKASR